MMEANEYEDLLMGTELRPMPRLSNAQTSIPPLELGLTAGAADSSSLGKSEPVNPLICGAQELWVPANPAIQPRISISLRTQIELMKLNH